MKRIKWNKLSGKTWENSVILFSFHVICITVLALLMSRFLLSDLSSIDAFSPAEKTSDFAMSDMYNSVSNRRAVKQLDQDVVIVSSDGCSRLDIANLIGILDSYSPAAIGLDIFFPYPTGNDSLLIANLSSCKNLVLPLQADSQVDVLNQSFFDGQIPSSYGFVNIELKNKRGTVRNYRPFSIIGGDSIMNFSVQLANLFDHRTIELLKSRSNKSEIIFFPSTEFRVINGQELITNDSLANFIQGKVILIGDLENASDSYITPLDDDMPGVMIHAYTVHSIIKSKFISISRTYVNWIVAIFVCLLYTIINVLAKKYFSNIGNFLMRILQVATMYLLFVIGCLNFVYHGLYVDFAPAIAMIGFGALAFDIWYGLYACYLKIKEFISQRRKS